MKFWRIACAVLIVTILMVLPGIVMYVVGDIANKLIPDSRGGEK